MMERLGLRFFERMSKKYPASFSPDDIHVLNPEERKALLRVQRNSIIRQALAGGVAAAICTWIGIWLWPYPDKPDAVLTWEESLWFYGWLQGLSFLVTMAELTYLYIDSLRSVHRLSTVAGLDLFPGQSEESGVAISLVRAALELPNPPDDLQGVNPRREISKFWLLVTGLIYKFKATATNFLFKALLRRVAGRSGLRTLMDFAGVPVFAFWNGLIAYWVLRQARIRAMGPSAIQEFSEVLYEQAEDLSEAAHLAAFQAIGTAIVRTVDLHPNLITFMKVSEKHLGKPEKVELDSSDLFLETLGKLNPKEQDFALKVMVVASIVDGKLARRERKLMKTAFEQCGLAPDLEGIVTLKKAFVRGDDIKGARLRSCLPGPGRRLGL